jgi:hypothetical protein
MGTVFNRGTKEKPSWYVGYRENGKWKCRPSLTRREAQAPRPRSLELKLKRTNKLEPC